MVLALGAGGRLGSLAHTRSPRRRPRRRREAGSRRPASGSPKAPAAAATGQGGDQLHGGDPKPAGYLAEEARGPSKWAIAQEGDPALSSVLADALNLQWAHGYPHTPRGFTRLTYGFHPYPAGLQPLTAQRLMEVLPGDSVMDPFVGGGCVPVEAMRAGRRAVGTDVSPLALFVSTYHSWRPSEEELQVLEATAGRVQAAGAERLAAAREVWRGRGQDSRAAVEAWDVLKGVIEEETEAGETRPVRGALTFCLSVANERAARKQKQRRRRGARGPGESPDQVLATACGHYALRLRALVDVVSPELPPAEILRGDARTVAIAEPVAAICTSPPYPGAYDYLSTARQYRSRLGVRVPEGGRALEFELTRLPEHRGSSPPQPKEWEENEFGARKQFRTDPGNFPAVFDRDQEAWLRAARGNLGGVRGARVAIVIGDGDLGYIDTLASTVRSAGRAGFAVKASASATSLVKGRAFKRPEHIILLEVE